MQGRNIDLLSLPYRDRQIIVVVKDDVDYHKRVPLKFSDYFTPEVGKANANPRNWVSLKHWSDSKSWGIYGYLFDKIREKFGETQSQEIKHLRKLRADAAEKFLVFPPGHPLYDTAYAGHPLKPTVYTPFGNFHRLLFEEKFNELLKLFWCLGAKKVSIKYVSGYRNEFEAAGKVPLPVDLPVTIEASGGRKRSYSSAVELEARFIPSGRPRIPEGLTWYPHEATWKHIAEGRLSGGLSSIDVSLRYEDDFGVNAEVALGLEQMGFKIGGEFQKHEKTTWAFHGSFG